MTSLIPARLFFIFICIASTATRQAIAADSQNEVESILLRLEDEWAQVDVTNDKSVFQRILAPEFVSTSRSGKFHSSRDAYLADWGYEGVTHAVNSDMIVHVCSADAAVVTGIDTTRGRNPDGTEWMHQDRFTDTWIKRDGSWRCVAAHVTRLK